MLIARSDTPVKTLPAYFLIRATEKFPFQISGGATMVILFQDINDKIILTLYRYAIQHTVDHHTLTLADVATIFFEEKASVQ